MKSIKISDDHYVKLLKLKAHLTSQDGKTRTFDDAIGEIFRVYELGEKLK